MPTPPSYTRWDTSREQIEAVPATDAVGKNAKFEEIYALRRKWCELDTQWWDAKEGSAERKELETQIKEIEKELEKLQSDTYTTEDLRPTCNLPKSSAVLPGKTLGGLKTRRRKHRNGSTRIQRHRSSRVSRRKRQTRRA